MYRAGAEELEVTDRAIQRGLIAAASVKVVYESAILGAADVGQAASGRAGGSSFGSLWGWASVSMVMAVSIESWDM